MKLCNTCSERKPLESFPRDHRYANGRRNKCKECVRVAGRQYWARRKASQAGADAVRQQSVFAQVAAECDVTRLLAADIERFRG